MAHELDFTTGKAGVAYVGETPWHGLGQLMIPGLPLDVWLKQAGLDWSCKRAGVMYEREFDDQTTDTPFVMKSKDDIVLYRSDSGAVLSIVKAGYKPVQPKQIIDFYKDLTEQHDFQIETAGSLKGGRKIWALAKTPHDFTLKGMDRTQLYLLLATSFDGTMATQARWTGVRVVCNNTIEIATMGRAEVVVPHSTTFDADKVKIELNVGDAWEQYKTQAAAMSEHPVSQEETARFILNVYFGLDTPEKIAAHAADEANQARVDKVIARVTNALFNSPGSALATARGMLWGLVNAVTNDADYTLPARTAENRLNNAWFGKGASLKQKAWDIATRMVA